MKNFKIKIVTYSLLSIVLFGACNDDLTNVGSSILPPGDEITVYSDTFLIKASTVKLDSVFAKTNECLLGEMYDPLYGNLKADFLCQFYCEENFKFNNTPYEGKIDSVGLYISYAQALCIGDTLAPMQATVYPIDRPLKSNFYTNENPENYCDMKNPLGHLAYTAYDISVSDSVRSLSTYRPSLRIELPVELGQSIYDETVNNPSSFASQEAFNEFFKGLYVTTTFGSGSFIRTGGQYIMLMLYYNYADKDTLGQDTLISAVEVFSTAKDVIQINRFKNENISSLLEEDSAHTYIKSPAGVCTKLTIPTSEIAQRVDIEERLINSFSINLKFSPQEEWDYAYPPPQYLLILPEDSVITFFENGNTENKTSLLSHRGSGTSAIQGSEIGYSWTTRTYYFGNLNSLIKMHIEDQPDEDLRLLVLPVSRETLATGSSQNYYVTTSLYNSLIPYGVKLNTSEEQMKVVLLSSEFRE